MCVSVCICPCVNVCVCVPSYCGYIGQACPFLLLVLREQLGDLQAALLASMLDVEAFRQGRSYDLKSPLSWADGLALIHSCPQDAHLLTLLGQSLVADPGLGTAKVSIVTQELRTV